MLADLRAEIDRIDLEMHRLLMQRGEIIDRLIEVKRQQPGCSAFRPDREAKMMRALVERHSGLLPLDAVEGIWRIIVSTFTYVQSPYAVHADDSGDDAQMRDSARFHFGFTVPYVAHRGALAVIDAVAAAEGDLGVLRSCCDARDGAWWTRLIGAEAPKIIARLPFVERPDHPAGLPVFVVAKPAGDAAATDIALYAVRVAEWSDAIPAALATLSAEILGSAAQAGGRALLVAAPGRAPAEDIRAALQRAGAGDAKVDAIGAHAARFELNEAQSGVLASGK